MCIYHRIYLETTKCSPKAAKRSDYSEQKAGWFHLNCHHAFIVCISVNVFIVWWRQWYYAQPAGVPVVVDSRNRRQKELNGCFSGLGADDVSKSDGIEHVKHVIIWFVFCDYERWCVIVVGILCNQIWNEYIIMNAFDSLQNWTEQK